MAAYEKMSERRKAAFLAELRLHGIVAWAARAASQGGGRGNKSASFRDERLRDAQFAAEWDEALEEADARIEREVFRRAVEGVDEPVYQQGELAGYVRRFSDRLAEVILRSRLRTKYADTRHVHHTGEIQHTSPLQISAEDLRLLPTNLQTQLMDLLRMIHRARSGAEDKPKVIEAKPATTSVPRSSSVAKEVARPVLPYMYGRESEVEDAEIVETKTATQIIEENDL